MTAPFPPFPHPYDPTAFAALEIMRRLRTPSPAPPPGSAVPRQPSDEAMPPGWLGGPHAVSPLAALSQQAHELTNPMTYAEALKGLVRPFQPIGRTASGAVVPFPGQKEMAEQVQELNRAGHPLLGLAAMGMGVGMPESEIGPEVSAATRPILSDIEHAASGYDITMPQAAIVSASRGELSATKNAARHKAMLADLKASGVPHVEVNGRWRNPESGKWETEKSVLIPGMERAQAVHYGDRWQQHSVITIGGDEPGLHNIGTGETLPFSGVRQAGRREAHTVLPSGRKISFDFEGAPRQTGTPTPQPMPKGAPGLAGVEQSGAYASEGRAKLPAGAPEVLGASDPKYAYKSPPTYHGTREFGFDVPTLSQDLGPHTGTLDQAEGRLYQSGHELGYTVRSPDDRILRLYSTAKNPLRLDMDLGMWHPSEVALTIASHPDIVGTPAENTFRQIADDAQTDLRMIAGKPNNAYAWTSEHDASRKGWLNEIKTALKAHGYDAIEYPNAFEGVKGEEGHSGFSTIHLDPEKTLSTTPTTRGFAIPQADVSGLAMGVAHLGAGAKNVGEYATAVAREHPQLGAQMQASPWLANKMFGTVRSYRKMLEQMPSPEQAIATARTPEGQGIQTWYNGLDRVLQDAGLSDRERDVFHRIGAISSMQKSPKDELARALDAFSVWKQHGPMADFSKMRNYTATQRKMLEGIAVDNPWTDVTKGPKVSGYVLARQNQPEGVALDRHINEYYTGKQHLNDTERQIVEGRLRSDASKAGMTAREFQAALWGGKTKYAPGYGQAGAPLEDWLRYHLASGKYDDLLEQVPGFQKLAEEGAHMGEHLPPHSAGGQGNLPF